MKNEKNERNQSRLRDVQKIQNKIEDDKLNYLKKGKKEKTKMTSAK